MQAQTIDELLVHFKNLLLALEAAGITVNPTKVYIGVRECVFYGYTLSRKGMSPAEKNLDPIQKMVAPINVSGVRSVLGMFNQFRSFFARYARLVLPITNLTKKTVDFVWSPECKAAMQTVRAKILSGDCYLAAPDHRVELCLDTDASDDGWGGCLYQNLPSGRAVIKQWSKQWGPTMAKAPPYHKEAAAWMSSVGLARVYAHGSPFPLHTFTDHRPLTFVRNTSGKGPVSQFVIDHLSDIDYIIEYKRGPDNTEADAAQIPMPRPKVAHGYRNTGRSEDSVGADTRTFPTRRTSVGISPNRMRHTKGHGS